MCEIVSGISWQQQPPSWLFQKNFEVNTTFSEKIGRVFHQAIALLAVGLLCVGSTSLFSCAVYAWVGRKVVAALIGHLVYPATWSKVQSVVMHSFQYVWKGFHEEQSDSLSLLKRAGIIEALELSKLGFAIKKIPLHKGGVFYDARVVFHEENIPDAWMICALGNTMTLEYSLASMAKKAKKLRCNMLIVNGPCVGESQGSPTRYQMGAGFEAGMQYVEKAIQAKKIILYGFSLGGGMMGEAIIQHDFTQGIQAGVQYLCISDRTFSKLSTEAKALAEWVILQGAQMTLRGVFVLTGMEPEENEEILKLKEEAQALVRGVSKVVGVFVSAAFLLTGLDLEVVAAAKKLTEKNIQHVVIQHRCDEEEGTDGVILDRASLAFSLQNKQENQLFLTSPELRHNSPLPIDIQNALSEKVSQFLQ